MRVCFGTRLGLRALTFAAAILLIGAPALAAKRVALVIGNSAYRSVPTLTNPDNDADDISAAFKRLGFTVREIKDGTYDAMRRGLLEFNRDVRGADIGIVFYAGHGIEVGGENWLIPVDAELRSDIDVDHEAIGLKSLLPALESTGKLGLVILDACRNNPFAAKMQRSIRTRSVSRGLAEIEPTGNVLVAYSAKDGTTAADGAGRNSPFTSSLLKYIETPGLEINFLFRNVRDDVIAMTNREQQPFVYGSLSKEAIFFKAAPQVVVAAPPRWAGSRRNNMGIDQGHDRRSGAHALHQGISEDSTSGRSRGPDRCAHRRSPEKGARATARTAARRSGLELPQRHQRCRGAEKVSPTIPRKCAQGRSRTARFGDNRRAKRGGACRRAAHGCPRRRSAGSKGKTHRSVARGRGVEPGEGQQGPQPVSPVSRPISGQCSQGRCPAAYGHPRRRTARRRSCAGATHGGSDRRSGARRAGGAGNRQS